jgi:hypothetical protein
MASRRRQPGHMGQRPRSISETVLGAMPVNRNTRMIDHRRRNRSARNLFLILAPPLYKTAQCDTFEKQYKPDLSTSSGPGKNCSQAISVCCPVSPVSPVSPGNSNFFNEDFA